MKKIFVVLLLTLAAARPASAHIAANTITASDIAAGTITADRLNISTLSAISADLGSVTAGSVVVGGSDKLWLNADGTYFFAVGGNSIGSAPFRVNLAGQAWMGNATVSGQLSIQAGGLLSVGASMTFPGIGGGSGNRFICVNGSDVVYASSTTCNGSAPEAAASPASALARITALEAEVARLTALLEQRQ
jgi:hypothetical protein